ncbi:MAG: PepSY domain-containing protein [Chromatiales bacterium]|jgi:uncharacterized membrane protein YkoI
MQRIARLICAILLCLSSAVSGDDSYLEARQLAREGKILPLEQILERIRKIRAGQILEVELEPEYGHMIYEIEMLDERGTVWELKVDAVSGHILEQELED